MSAWKAQMISELDCLDHFPPAPTYPELGQMIEDFESLTARFSRAADRSIGTYQRPSAVRECRKLKDDLQRIIAQIVDNLPTVKEDDNAYPF